jgi:DNA polymerase-3 subunit gamma/tau
VRLLDLVSQALEATANGAQARIQLELVLVKAAAPDMDPSVAALQARVERLEEGGSSASVAANVRAGEAPAPARDRESAGAGATGANKTVETAEAPARPQKPGVQQEAASTEAPVVEAASPRPEPSSTPAEPASAITLDTAVESWPAVADLVRVDNAMLAALLSEARPVSVTDRELTLAFPAGAAFLKRKAEQDANRRVAIDALKSITGQRLALCFELRELAPDEAPEGPEVLSGDELVRRFMEEFDAEEILDDGSEHGDHKEKEAEA